MTFNQMQPIPGPSLQEINQQHESFHRQQSILRDERLQDAFLYKSAMRLMNSEMRRGVPLKFCTSLEAALADAETERIRFRKELAREGGVAPKADALSVLIETIVMREPEITAKRLLSLLKRLIGEGVIVSIDTEERVVEGDVRRIHFEESDGKEKSASVRGLKDRLARAKAKINSR
jgi:hypothetical protein